jgi:hypothetical protein
MRRLLGFALFTLTPLACSSDPANPSQAGGSGGSGGTAGTGSGTAGAGSGGTAGSVATGGTGATGGAAGSASGAAGASAGSGGTAGSVAGTGGLATGGAGGTSGGSAGSGAGTAGTGGDLAGSGGTAGDASGGTSGASGSAGSTGSVGCTGSELLCEDFEDTADGMVPTGDPWKPLDASCEFQTAQFTMGVTGELANGGSKSLKVTNKHFAQCRLSGQFAMVDDFWVRAYSYWEAALDISNRETLDIDLTPGYRTADDPAVRFGYRSKAPCEEYAGPQVTIIGLAGGEATGCGSRAMPKGEWFCFEAHVTQASNLVVQTYVNGEAISYQSTGKPLTETIQTETAITEKVDHIRLGIFSTGEAQGSIYLDDVAVSATRLGCGN